MKKIFDQNAPLMNGWTVLFDIMLLSVAWFLCSLPIVTAGAATAALAHVLIAMSEGEPCHLGLFFRGVAQTWKKATVFWVLLLAAGGILYLDLCIAGNMTGGFKVLVLSGSFFILPCLCILAVAGFLLLGRTPEISLKQLVVHALLLGIYKLPRTVLILMVLAIPLLLGCMSPFVFFTTGFIWIVFWPAGTMYLTVKLLKP